MAIMIVTRPVDFWLGVDDLAATVRSALRLHPHLGLAVIFRSEWRNRLKIVVWDGAGLFMVYERRDQPPR